MKYFAAASASAAADDDDGDDSPYCPGTSLVLTPFKWESGNYMVRNRFRDVRLLCLDGEARTHLPCAIGPFVYFSPSPIEAMRTQLGNSGLMQSDNVADSLPVKVVDAINFVK